MIENRIQSRAKSNLVPARTLQTSAFFKLRQRAANWLIDSQGLWSYPAFIKSNTGELDRLSIVLAAVPMPAKKRTALFRPKAMVIIKGDSTTVIRYENFRLGHDPFAEVSWDKPVAMYPHQAIANLTRKDLADREQALLASYADAEGRFAKTGKLPQPFAAEFISLIHPVFLPYVRYLASPFFNALDVERRVAMET